MTPPPMPRLTFDALSRQFMNIPHHLHQLAALFAYARSETGEHPYYLAYGEFLKHCAISSVRTVDPEVMMLSVYPQARLAGGIPAVFATAGRKNDAEVEEDEPSSDEDEVEEDDFDEYKPDTDSDNSEPSTLPSELRRQRSREASRPFKMEGAYANLPKISHPSPPQPLIEVPRPRPRANANRRYPDFAVMANLYEEKEGKGERLSLDTLADDFRKAVNIADDAHQEISATGHKSMPSQPSSSNIISTPKVHPSKNDPASKVFLSSRVNTLHSVWEIKWNDELTEESGNANTDLVKNTISTHFDLALRQVVGQAFCGFQQYPRVQEIDVFFAMDKWVKHVYLERENMPDSLRTVGSASRKKLLKYVYKATAVPICVLLPPGGSTELQGEADVVYAHDTKSVRQVGGEVDGRPFSKRTERFEKAKMKKRATVESDSTENVEDLLPERSDGKIDSPLLIFNPQFLDLWREVTEYTYERLVSESHNDSAEAVN